MIDLRKKNVDWVVAESSGSVPSWERVQVAVLMDIRDELQSLNGLLRCPNFQAIPMKLDRISRNTAKPRRKKTKPGSGVRR